VFNREAEIQALESAYPEGVRRVSRLFTDRKAHVVNPGEVVLESTARAQDLAAEYARLALDKEAREAFYRGPGLNPHNEFSMDDSNWSGMGAEKLAREYRGETHALQEELEKAREELARTGMKETLEASMAGVRKKRRRCLSEHDGDWDMDRKYDAFPFLSTKMAKREFPYLEIIFPLAMNSSASKEQIARFNARCLALAEVLEGAGYRVAITGETWIRDLIIECPEVDRLHAEVTGKKGGKVPGQRILQLERLVFRDADEYGDAQSFAAYTSTEFFRRTVFSMVYCTAHYRNGLKSVLTKDVDYSYGQSISERPLPALPGQLVLTHDTVSRLFSMSEETREETFRARVLHTIQNAKGKALAS
jgi:hypothetical protein